MRLRRRVVLGSTYLDELDSSIVVQNVDPGTPQESISTVPRMGGAGSRVTSSHYDMLECTVTFGIDLPKESLAARREVFNKVVAWAMARGYLKVTSMPNRRMYVEKVIIPSCGDLFEWTNSFTITFRAYGVPFWQDSTPTTVTKSTITNGSITFEIGGNVETTCAVTCHNKSGKVINNLSVTAGKNKMTFASLGLAANEDLVIDHSNGILRIRIKNTSGTYRSAMACRTGADDLWISPGANTITIASDRAVQLTVTSYGRWL